MGAERLAPRLALLGVLATPVIVAAASPGSAAQNLAQHGAPGITACATCHGQAGEGNAAAGYPRLADLPGAYLAAQLAALADGTRQSAVMGPLARALGAAQRSALAAYYASLPVAVAPGNAASAAGVGFDARLALYGRWSDGVPPCVQCHGSAGGGIGSAFPPLTGQPERYLDSQLRAWRAGLRHGDPLELMQGIAQRLSDQDMLAVSGYFAALPASPAGVSATPAPPMSPAAAGGGAEGRSFVPASHAVADDAFGRQVRAGERIFDDTGHQARRFVGNTLRCSDCHLDQGRRVGSAPLWAAYVSYPAYRSKNHHVNTFAERLQGCFRYSMNGTAPPLGNPVLVALETYAYWMALGAPLDPHIAGRGYPKLPKPVRPANYARGARLYAEDCALCHGPNGEGQPDRAGEPAFPALWGADSYNWGAGMADIPNVAGFVKANMPLSRAGLLSDQQAWDVALYVDSQERPQDPRFTGSVADTRRRFHDGEDSMYGRAVNGQVLGSHSVPPGGP